MAEQSDPKELARIQELLMANSILAESLTQLLIDKGIITDEEFITKLKQVQAEYQKKADGNCDQRPEGKLGIGSLRRFRLFKCAVFIFRVQLMTPLPSTQNFITNPHRPVRKILARMDLCNRSRVLGSKVEGISNRHD